MAERLWLVGMMGSGKSTVGVSAARQLGIAHHDTDAVVEDRAGMPVEDLFEAIGVVAFRDLERQAVDHAASLSGIISTGGGAIIDPRSRATMTETGTVVYLSADPATLSRRVGDPASRPLLAEGNVVQTLTELLVDRERFYVEAAHQVIDTTDKARRDVVEEVIALWNAS